VFSTDVVARKVADLRRSEKPIHQKALL